MTIYELPLMDTGGYIVVIGAVLFVLGLVALGGAIILIRNGFQNNETNSPLQSIISILSQIIGGAVGWITLNSLFPYAGFLLLGRICVDRDDIACGMVVLIPLFLAAVSIYLGSAMGILFLILYKKRGIAAGGLIALGIITMAIGSFLFAQIRFK